MRNKVFKKIMDFLPIPIMVGLLVALGYSIYYTNKLEEQIWERDKTIQKLSFRSDLVEKYFDIEYNPNDSLTYYTLKDSIINKFSSAKELAQERKNYDEILIILDDAIKQHNELINDYNALVQKYNCLLNEVNTISKEKNQLKEDKRRMEMVLRLIEKNYKITYKINVDSNMVTTSLRNTDMVDSALMLLPYYKNNLEKKEDGTWIITHPKD